MRLPRTLRDVCATPAMRVKLDSAWRVCNPCYESTAWLCVTCVQASQSDYGFRNFFHYHNIEQYLHHFHNHKDWWQPPPMASAALVSTKEYRHATALCTVSGTRLRARSFLRGQSWSCIITALNFGGRDSAVGSSGPQHYTLEAKSRQWVVVVHSTTLCRPRVGSGS